MCCRYLCQGEGKRKWSIPGRRQPPLLQCPAGGPVAASAASTAAAAAAASEEASCCAVSCCAESRTPLPAGLLGGARENRPETGGNDSHSRTAGDGGKDAEERETEEWEGPLDAAPPHHPQSRGCPCYLPPSLLKAPWRRRC